MNHSSERNGILNCNWSIRYCLFYCLMPYDFVCVMGFITHRFFHRFHGHLQNIFCTHLMQAPYDALSGNSPLQDARFVHSTWLISAILHKKCKQYISPPLTSNDDNDDDVS